MQRATLRPLRTACLSIALLSATATGTWFTATDGALAAGGNGNGNGSGHSKGDGGRNTGDHSGTGEARGNSASAGNGAANGHGKNAGGAEHASGTSFSKSDRSAGGSATSFSAKEKSPEGKSSVSRKDSTRSKSHSKRASELGALNAAHASTAALESAAPNSRVGRIAAYKGAVLEGQELQACYDLALVALAEQVPPSETSASIAATLDDRVSRRTEAQDALDGLRQDLADVQSQGGTDPDLEQEIAAAEADLALRDAEIADLERSKSAAEDYEAAASTVDDLSAQLSEQRRVEASLLDAAANKPVTAETGEAVQALLGLD